MSGRSAPRSRKETRAAVLESLLRSKTAVRTGLARASNLTEASISRILTELRNEAIVTETRHPAAAGGPPTSIVSLSNDIAVLGIELSNSRLSFGVGDLSGTLDYVERMPASTRLSQDAFEQVFTDSMQAVGEWADARGVTLRQAAMSIPGYGRRACNPIYSWDMDRLERFVVGKLRGVPLALTNSVVAQAALHRYARTASQIAAGNHLFLFVGHGVAGVLVDDAAPVDAFSAIEIGHMVMERGGEPCRCGHRGCLEAYTSLRAVSQIIGISDQDLLTKGDRFLEALDVAPDARAALGERQFMLGLALGNALNLHSVRKVVISGWPSLLPEAQRTPIFDGLDQSLLGGFAPGRVEVGFIEPSIGNDPKAALTYAAYCFVRGGGLEEASGARAVLEENV